MSGKVGLVNAGVVIEALKLRGGGDRKQIAVAGHVLSQQHQVRGVLIARDILVVHAARSQVSLEPDDRFDAFSGGCLEEIQRAKHGAVVCQRKGRHTQFFGTFDQCRRTAKAVKHRVSRVNMQMNE